MAVAAAVSHGTVISVGDRVRSCSAWPATPRPRTPSPAGSPGCSPPAGRSRSTPRPMPPHLDAAQRSAVEHALRAGVTRAHRRAGHRQEPHRGRRSSRWPSEPASRSRSPRRPVAPPSGWRSCAARRPRRCTACWARSRGSRGEEVSLQRRVRPQSRTGRWTRTWSSSTRRRCWTSSWPTRCCPPARTAPICCSSATPAQLPSIGPGRRAGRRDRLRHASR